MRQEARCKLSNTLRLPQEGDPTNLFYLKGQRLPDNAHSPDMNGNPYGTSPLCKFQLDSSTRPRS